jgi:hypothetical protein
LAWISIRFPIGSVAVILLVEWCYTLFEIKYLIINSVLFFEISSVVYGVVLIINTIIIGRVIAGLGGISIYLR